MKSFIPKLNDALALISGLIILSLAFLTTFETVARSVFSSPTTWTLDISRYLVFWAIFLGVSSAFLKKTHISVDFVREALGNKFGMGLRRILTICGYLFSLIFVSVLLWNSIDLIITGLRFNRLTLGNVQIPIVYLYLGMLLGSIVMAITLVYIIRDLLRKNDNFL